MVFILKKAEKRNALEISSNAGSDGPDKSNSEADNTGGTVSQKLTKSLRACYACRIGPRICSRTYGISCIFKYRYVGASIAYQHNLDLEGH